MKWISCLEKLPKRLKTVHVQNEKMTFLAKRSIFFEKWILESGIKIPISHLDYWR